MERRLSSRVFAMVAGTTMKVLEQTCSLRHGGNLRRRCRQPGSVAPVAIRDCGPEQQSAWACRGC